MSGKSNRTPDVEAVFAAYPAKVNVKLRALRQLIFDTAAVTDGVGPLKETLKWGQPSYLTAESKSGSTIRIDRLKDDDGRYAMYFHCQTNLIATFRELYADDLTFDGNRAILFDAKDRIPLRILRHCVSLALTYHLNRSRRRESRASV